MSVETLWNIRTNTDEEMFPDNNHGMIVDNIKRCHSAFGLMRLQYYQDETAFMSTFLIVLIFSRTSWENMDVSALLRFRI